MLQLALDLLDSFLSALDHYDLLLDTDRKLFEQFQDDKKSFTLMSSSNAEERRRIKISRFQQEKSLKSKLEVGFSDSIYGSSTDVLVFER